MDTKNDYDVMDDLDNKSMTETLGENKIFLVKLLLIRE